MTDDLTSAASALRAARVAEVMSFPLVTCTPDVPLAEVAELMTRHRIHAVVVLADPGRHGADGLPWGVISELDLVAAAPFEDPGTTAGRVAGSPVVVIAPDESLGRAAMLMAEYGVTHLIVVGSDGEPAGIVSALDVAKALPPPRAAAPAEPEIASPSPRLQARSGDRLVIAGHQLGQPERDAEILEARGAEGGPPFLVRWEDGRVSLLYPGSDAAVDPLGRLE